MHGQVHLVERIPFHDALYFVTTTLTTVGYGDVVAVSPLGKAAVLGMICVGVVLIPVQTSQLYAQLTARRVTLGAQAPGLYQRCLAWWAASPVLVLLCWCIRGSPLQPGRGPTCKWYSRRLGVVPGSSKVFCDRGLGSCAYGWYSLFASDAVVSASNKCPLTATVPDKLSVSVPVSFPLHGSEQSWSEPGAIPKPAAPMVLVGTRLSEVRGFSDFFSEFFTALRKPHFAPNLRMVVLCTKPTYELRAFQV